MTRLGWDAVADEYYDAARHPTTARLREMSHRLVSTWLAVRDGVCLEVGAGRSSLVELGLGQPIVATDSAREMIRRTAAGPALLAQARAAQLPFRPAVFDFVAAVLGSPYNAGESWREVARVLRPGGLVVYTAPEHEWAQADRRRRGSDPDRAQYLVEGGSRIALPSIVRPRIEQIELVEAAGLHVLTDAVVSEGGVDLFGLLAERRMAVEQLDGAVDTEAVDA